MRSQYVGTILGLIASAAIINLPQSDSLAVSIVVICLASIVLGLSVAALQHIQRLSHSIDDVEYDRFLEILLMMHKNIGTRAFDRSLLIGTNIILVAAMLYADMRTQACIYLTLSIIMDLFSQYVYSWTLDQWTLAVSRILSKVLNNPNFHSKELVDASMRIRNLHNLLDSEKDDHDNKNH